MSFSQNNLETSFATSRTWATVERTGGYNVTPGPSFIHHTNGNTTTLEYTNSAVSPRTVQASASVCWEVIKGAAVNIDPQDIQIAFAVDTGSGFVVIEETIQDSMMNSHHIVYPRNATCAGVFSISSGDTVALQVRNLTSTQTIQVKSLNFTVQTVS